jgi:ketosteroid isomerase-like protein
MAARLAAAAWRAVGFRHAKCRPPRRGFASYCRGELSGRQRMTAADALTASFAAWERGDPDALADLFADDGVLEDPLKPGTIVGREPIREESRPAMAALSDCRITITHMLERDDIAFCEGLFAAGLAGSDGRLDFPFAAVLEMRGGRIGRLAEYFDTRPLVG